MPRPQSTSPSFRQNGWRKADVLLSSYSTKANTRHHAPSCASFGSLLYVQAAARAKCSSLRAYAAWHAHSRREFYRNMGPRRRFGLSLFIVCAYKRLQRKRGSALPCPVDCLDDAMHKQWARGVPLLAFPTKYAPHPPAIHALPTMHPTAALLQHPPQ